MKFVTRVNPKSCHQKEKKFFLFNFISIGGGRYSLNLLWQ